MLTRKEVFGAKTEAAQNTPETLAATDFINAWDIEFNPDAELLEKLWHSSSLDAFPSGRGKLHYEPKVKTDIKPSGVVATPPVISPLLQACGLTETIVGATSVTYARTSAPASASYLGPGKSATLKAYQDGILHVVAGAIGSSKLIFEPGKTAVAEWDLKGLWAAVTDAAIPANTPDTVAPPKVQSMAVSVHTFTPIVHKLEIDLGNEVVEIPDVNSIAGIKGYKITGWKSKVNFTVDATLVATHDWFGKLAAGTTGALTFAINNGAGKIMTVTLAVVEYQKVTAVDVNGMRAFQVEAAIVRNTGDDSLVMAFT
jgi:hypothetical protein